MSIDLPDFDFDLDLGSSPNSGGSGGSFLDGLPAATVSAIAAYLAAREGRKGQDSANDQNAQLQREFAQMGIQWRVADAKKAGIHPIYALGASGPSASPSYQAADRSGEYLALGQMGQNITSAVTRTMDKRQRENQAVMDNLTLERAQLENNLLKTQLINAQGPTNPPFPGGNYGVPGQPDTGMVQSRPQVKVIPATGDVYSEPGTITDVGWADTPTGLAPVPSQNVKERIEDQIIPEAMWALRNHVIPSVSLGYKGSRPPWQTIIRRWPNATGMHWSFHKQEWQPSYQK